VDGISGYLLATLSVVQLLLLASSRHNIWRVFYHQKTIGFRCLRSFVDGFYLRALWRLLDGSWLRRKHLHRLNNSSSSPGNGFAETSCGYRSYLFLASAPISAGCGSKLSVSAALWL
jgi:hypothetical protein